MEVPQYASSLSLLENNNLYVIGKRNLGGVKPDGTHSQLIYRYTDTWTRLIVSNQDMFAERASHCGFIENGWIYVYGGQEESISSSKIFGSWLRIQVDELQWESFGEESKFSGRHSASCVYNPEKKCAYVYGGANSEGILDDLLILNTGKT